MLAFRHLAERCGLAHDNRVEIVDLTAADVPSMHTSRIVGGSAVILLSTIWGLAFVAIRHAVLELTPVSLTLARFLVAGGVFFTLLLTSKKARANVERKDIPRLLVISGASVPLYHLSLNYAETIVGAGLAGLLISLWPVFSVILSVIFLGEKPRQRLYLAVATGLSGATVLSLYGQSNNLDPGILLGPFAVIFSALMSAVFTVLSKPLALKYGTIPLASLTVTLGTVMLLPLLNGSVIEDIRALSTTGWVSVLFLALLSTVLSYILLYTLLRAREVSTLSVQFYLVPLVSLLGGIIILHEQPTIGTAVGGALLILAVALATATEHSSKREIPASTVGSRSG